MNKIRKWELILIFENKTGIQIPQIFCFTKEPEIVYSPNKIAFTTEEDTPRRIETNLPYILTDLYFERT